MPAKPKSAAEFAEVVTEDAIRERAYFLWEADGRPHGNHDHYWHRAHEEATKAYVESTSTKVAKATGGKNPAEPPPAVKAKMKVKASSAKPKKPGTKLRAAVPVGKPH